VVIDDFDVEDIPTIPTKANPPLIVDSDAVLSLACSLQSFQTVRRRDPKIGKSTRTIQHSQFPQSHLVNIARQLPGADTLEDFFGLF